MRNISSQLVLAHFQGCHQPALEQSDLIILLSFFFFFFNANLICVDFCKQLGKQGLNLNEVMHFTNNSKALKNLN